jgi:hypothetical protein
VRSRLEGCKCEARAAVAFHKPKPEPEPGPEPEPDVATIVESLDAKLDRTLVFDRRIPLFQ